MPGRQSTGPLAPKSSKAKKQVKQRALNALAIAEQQEPERIRTRHHRLGENDQQIDKRKREVSEASSDEDGESGKARKKLRAIPKGRNGDQLEGGSDSDRNEWVFGQVAGDDDSDLDSDQAMGKSDEDRFEDFSFRGSSTLRIQKKPKKLQPSTDIGIEESDNEVLEEDEESDEFKEEAVDLANMLDAHHDERSDSGMSEDNKISGTTHSKNWTDDDNSIDGSTSELSISDTEDQSNDDVKLSALQTLVTSMGDDMDPPLSDRNRNRDTQEFGTPSEFGLGSNQKLTVADLITTVTDPKLRKSLKLLAEDSGNSTKKSSGISQKLEVPLAKRQQDRIDRAAAYEKSKETLNRWIDTVKHNRRAEHLSFPLQDPEAYAAKGTTRLLPTQQSKPMTSLESTIQSILIDTGLLSTDGRSQEDQVQAFEELQTDKLPIEEVQAKRAELRKARELLFREEIRAKRIKKIKSKSFRRVHRRERDRNAQQEKEALAIAGLCVSGDEQERNDRRRAEERMGARHRESKWAKGLKNTGRTLWDENARNGVAEMAKRDEDLRRRIEGKDAHEDDDFSNSSSGSSDEDGVLDDDNSLKPTQKLEKELRNLDSNREANPFKQNSGFKLASMKFMQNAEKNRKEQNDSAVETLRREITGNDLSDDFEGDEISGRRVYGPTKDSMKSLKIGAMSKETVFDEGAVSNDKAFHPAQSERSNKDSATNETEISKSTILSTKRLQQPRDANTKSTSSTRSSSLKPENPWLSCKSTHHSSKERKALTTDSVVLISNSPNVNHSASGRTVELSSKTEQTGPRTMFASSSASFNGFSSDSDSEAQATNSALPNNQDLIRQAFAGDEVVASFEAEKISAIKEDEEKVIDSTLPGWGSWTGAGLSKKEEKRNKGKVFEKKEGIKKEKRVDWGLEKVIINEKRVKKVGYSTKNLIIIGALIMNIELQIPCHYFTSSFRGSPTVRTLTPPSLRPGVDDEGDIPRCNEAANLDETGYNHTDRETSDLIEAY